MEVAAISYLKIPNLYKCQDILLFKECYAAEKAHGTSSHLSWNEGQLNLFSGGVSQEQFEHLFSKSNLRKKFSDLGVKKCIIFGEAYGGKCQSMQEIYGPKLKFIAFEVKINDCWLNVANAYDVAHNQFGLDFVPYAKIPAEMKYINQERDKSSVIAERNGMGDDHIREGIVLRPLIEVTKNNGDRIMAKHKTEFYQERHHQPKVKDTDPKKLEKLKKAEEIAKEWVTEMRLTHILDKFSSSYSISDTGDVIRTMIADIKKEAENEIEWGDHDKTRRIEKAIGRETALKFKARIRNQFSV